MYKLELVKHVFYIEFYIYWKNIMYVSIDEEAFIKTSKLLFLKGIELKNREPIGIDQKTFDLIKDYFFLIELSIKSN